MKTLDDLFDNTESEEKEIIPPSSSSSEKKADDSEKDKEENKEENKEDKEEEGKDINDPENNTSKDVDEDKDNDKDKNKNNEGNEDEEDNFWGQVARLSGEELEVDFGDIDPTTPEGALKYAQAYREKGIEDFFETLKKNHPREHRALELVAEGYDPSSLYEKVTNKDYKTITLGSDTVQHKEILLDFCKSKGLDDETSRDLIEAAENKGTLKERSEAALKSLKEDQEKKEEKQKAILDEKIKRDQVAIDAIADSIQSKIQSGNISGFNIPEKDKNLLIKSMYDNIQIIDGKVLYVKELTQDSLDRELQAEYLKLKKGNLNDIVLRAKETKNVLRLQSKKEKEFSKNADTRKRTSSVKTLDDLF